MCMLRCQDFGVLNLLGYVTVSKETNFFTITMEVFGVPPPPLLLWGSLKTDKEGKKSKFK